MSEHSTVRVLQFRDHSITHYQITGIHSIGSAGAVRLLTNGCQGISLLSLICQVVLSGLVLLY